MLVCAEMNRCKHAVRWGKTQGGNGSCLLHCMKVMNDSSIIELYTCILTCEWSFQERIALVRCSVKNDIKGLIYCMWRSLSAAVSQWRIHNDALHFITALTEWEAGTKKICFLFYLESCTVACCACFTGWRASLDIHLIIYDLWFFFLSAWNQKLTLFIFTYCINTCCFCMIYLCMLFQVKKCGPPTTRTYSGMYCMLF